MIIFMYLQKIIKDFFTVVINTSYLIFGQLYMHLYKINFVLFDQTEIGYIATRNYY